ncbi:ribosome small subunit-dependent GTPase A [Novosphingobium sp.]|uniref:ribosome small subunit-dependent GTPase A n=1 Tax=Novosphingobium sp. TaxID=1874826 RepID=UPI003D0B3039
MTAHTDRLNELGWAPHFSDQLSAADTASLQPVRVMAVHRGQIAVAGATFAGLISPHIPGASEDSAHATVGDWLLLNPNLQIARVLDRANVFKRRTPGNVRKEQLIAANVDTLFVVASCNQDFNLARLERYLVLAREVGVTPVVVLTKIDKTADAETYAEQARTLQPDLDVEAINGKDPASALRLAAWCGPGRTVALVGSSGVGKSTLINTLTGSSDILTQAVREADGKGRHTTTVREMHRLPQGGWLMDTPGMRELHLSDAPEGLAEVFDDIVSLALECRFSNCTHDKEPGCAIRPKLADGTLDPARYARWRKLVAEDGANALLARRRSRS